MPYIFMRIFLYGNYREITLKILEFILKLDRKSKTCFLTNLNVYVSWIKETKSLPYKFYLQNLGILQTRLNQSVGVLHENEF